MMDGFFATEIRLNYEKIEKLEKDLSLEEKIKRHVVFKERAKKIMEYSRYAKKEGILSLEDRINDSDENEEKALFKKLIIQIAEGADPKLIEKWAMYDYASKVREPYESILYIITVCGIRSIQSGDRIKSLETLMNSMIPSDVAIEPSEYDDGSKVSESEGVRKDIEEYCVGELRVKKGEIGYIDICAVDALLRTITERDIQRLLREITNGDLAKLMPGLSGEARKRIFDNMPSMLAKMVLEDVGYMGAYDEEPDWIIEESKGVAKEVLMIAEQLREQGDIKF